MKKLLKKKENNDVCGRSAFRARGTGLAAAILSAALLFTACSGRGGSTPDADVNPPSAPLSAPVEITPSPSPTPPPYTILEVDTSTADAGGLVLVNWEHEFNYTDEVETVVISELADDNLLYDSDTARLVPDAFEALEALAEAFRNVTGGDRLFVTSAYRDLEYQQRVYDDYVEEHGRELADIYVAAPGFSEHHTGLAVDLSTVDAAGKRVPILDHEYGPWLGLYCAEYGFVLRYPIGKEAITHIAYEPWHFRYLGVPNALAVTELGITFDEYVEQIKQYTPESGMLYVQSLTDGTKHMALAAGPLSAPTGTDAPIATDTPIVTEVPTVSETPTASDTPIASETPTATEVPTVSDSPTVSDTPTVSETPTATPSPAAIPTPTRLPTPPAVTPTPVPTPTPHIAALDVVTFESLPETGWLIYYVPASSSAVTEIPVPVGASSCIVSGGNDGGFIVTVTL